MQPIYINPYQPKRDWENHGFRTHIPYPGYPYHIYSEINIVAQAQLYQWANTEYVNFVSQHDLHQYLFSHIPYISKKTMGTAIVNATIYNPRHLKGKTISTKATQCYLWRRRSDLIHGLEWPLSMVLVKSGYAEEIEEKLHFLSTAPRSKIYDFTKEIASRLLGTPEPDWQQIFEDHGLPIIPVDDNHMPDWGDKINPSIGLPSPPKPVGKIPSGFDATG